MWKFMLLTSLLALTCLFPATAPARAADDVATLKKENELLKKENELLKKEIELLTKENALLKKEGGGKSGEEKPASLAKATIDDVEYKIVGMKMNGAIGEMRIAVTSLNGRKQKRGFAPMIVRLYAADGTEVRGDLKPPERVGDRMNPYLEGTPMLEVVAFPKIPTNVKEFTSVRIGRGGEGIQGEQQVVLKGNFTFEGR